MKKTAQKDTYSHILKYTGIFGGVQVLGILIGLVRNKIAAVLLGPGGFGIISLFNSTIKFFGDSTNLGIPMSAVKEISYAYEAGDRERLKEKVHLIRSWCFLTAVLGTLLCVALAPLLDAWTFNWGNHTLHFRLLSPVVGLLSIAGGELAILKGCRRLKPLALISLYQVMAAVVISLPLYYFYGEAGIVPSMVLAALAQLLITVVYSYRQFPPCLSLSLSRLREGRGMVRLGTAFVLAGILGSGAELVIRSYLNNKGGLADLGLYNAGYMLTMTYAGLVFSAMETDFFPRLSGACHDLAKTHDLVNSQISVSLLLVGPMLVCFIVSLPILLPLLYTGEFLPVRDMIHATVFAMLLRALLLPMEYMNLAQGASRAYLFLEAIYDVSIVLLVVWLFPIYGLVGTGMALTLAAVVNFLVVYLFVGRRYRFRLSADVARHALIFVVLLSVTLAATRLDGLLYWVIGTVCAVLSIGISFCFLSRHTDLPDRLRCMLNRQHDES